MKYLFLLFTPFLHLFYDYNFSYLINISHIPKINETYIDFIIENSEHNIVI